MKRFLPLLVLLIWHVPSEPSFSNDFSAGLQDMHEQMQRVEEQMLRAFEGVSAARAPRQAPRLTIEHDNEVVTFSAHLPGVEDVKAVVDEGQLQIKLYTKEGGQRVGIILVNDNYVEADISHKAHEKKEEEKNGNVTYQSSSYYRAREMRMLPDQINLDDAGKIHVEFKDHTLRVKLPKVQRDIKTITVHTDVSAQEGVRVKKKRKKK